MSENVSYTVYKIECSANGKRYIGRTNNLKRRTIDHFSSLRAGKHSCKPLQADFNEYGEDSFSIEPIETCDD